ncbi:radical SAM protein [candidate division WOR-3 bacterium]|nr:radical SAM protein [candidate division WOR-3 bacterium]
MQKYIYGPVPSRRLGFSLGVDLVPYKTCSFDCIYCQLGVTTNQTIERKEYVKRDNILPQVKEAISLNQKIDYITLSGSGEPALNSAIGEIILGIKKLTKIPLAVLTNGSLLYDRTVRKELLPADLVIPSLDAADLETFNLVNRPHASLNFDEIILGLKDFRHEFKGKIWLEIMLIKGINASSQEIEHFKSIISEIGFDKVQLNTVIRPPTEKSISPLTPIELEKIKNAFGENCEIIPEFKKKLQKAYPIAMENRIIELVKRRPVTLSDISDSLGIHRNEVIKYLEILKKESKIKTYNYGGRRYYEYK